MPDDLDRNKMYRADDDDDDVEYEVEPPDAEVVAAAERRAEESLAASKYHIDVDELYREREGRDAQMLDHLFKDTNFRFQFQVKHLLIGTAILAVLLTLTKAAGFATILILLFMAAVGIATLYLQWQEHKRRQEADRRREQLYAERRDYLLRRNSNAKQDKMEPEPSSAAPLPPDAFEAARFKAAAAPNFRIEFSRRHITAGLICIAVVFGLTYALGGLAATSTVCGLLALFGLVVYAFGFHPPEVVVFVWWSTVLAYVALSILTTIFGIGP